MSNKKKWTIVKEAALKPKYNPLKGGAYGPASRVKIFSQEDCDAWMIENKMWVNQNLKKFKKKAGENSK